MFDCFFVGMEVVWQVKAYLWVNKVFIRLDSKCIQAVREFEYVYTDLSIGWNSHVARLELFTQTSTNDKTDSAFASRIR